MIKQSYRGGIENQYLCLLDDILIHGDKTPDRTGTGTKKVFGRTLRADLKNGFPLLTTKSVHFPSVAHELVWFISGKDNIQYLWDHNVSIWDEWADKNGNVGRMYGVQWRHWIGPDGKEIDQLQDAINTIKSNPYDRRIIVSAWNPAEIKTKQMALPPCHAIYQFDVHDKNRLSCAMYQRSVDTFLGLPFNIASYALLTIMIANLTDLVPDELVLFLGNTHLYLNHLKQAEVQLERQPKKLPTVEITRSRKRIDLFKFEDFKLDKYHPYSKIPAKISK